MAKPPRFTDSKRFKYAYADSKTSAEPGYLARRFEEIRAEQERNAKEAEAKCKPLKRAAEWEAAAAGEL